MRSHCSQALTAERKAGAASLEFVAIGEKTRPLGSTAQNMEHLGTLSGQEALTYTIEVLNLYNETILQDAPRLLAEVRDRRTRRRSNISGMRDP